MNKRNICGRISLVIILITSGFGCMKKEITVRPVSIKVIDSKTKKPLEGIGVIYTLRSFVRKNKILFILPNPLPRDIEKFEVIENYVTDSNGELRIKKRKLKLKKKEWLYAETIFVNLDFPEKATKRYGIKNIEEKISFMVAFIDGLDEDYRNPIKTYSGCVIFNYSWELDNRIQEWPVGYTIWNGKTFQKEKEEFVIELKRHEQNKVKPPNSDTLKQDAE